MKLNFEDAFNYAMAIAGAIVAVKEIKKVMDECKAEQDMQAATRWGREVKARLSALVSHAMKNRMSKEAYIETLMAAKNVIDYEADELHPGNYHAREEVRTIHAYIDDLINTVK